MFTPTFRLPWDYIGCGTPRIELVQYQGSWRACLLNFDADAAIDGFDAETLESVAIIFKEAAEYIKKADNATPFLFEEMTNELQEQPRSESGSMDSECC